jgi:ribosomal protein L7/L12
MDTKKDDIQSNMNILNNAYLVRDNPELEKQVGEALASILSTGEKGVSILLDRLYEGVSISGRSIQLKNWGDMTWNEFLIKREIIRALQNGYAKSASGRLEALLNADCRVGQWSEIVVPALRSALESLGSSGKVEQPTQDQKDGSSSAQPSVQAQVVPIAVEAKVRALLARNTKLDAIKLVRQHTKWDLSKAKDYVDQLEGHNAPYTTSSAENEIITTTIENQIIEVEAETLKEAREKAIAQIPEDLDLVYVKIISDGKPMTVQAIEDTTEEAFAKAQGEIPANASILEKKEIATPDQKVVMVEALDEQSARAQAEIQIGKTAKVKAVRLKTAGKQGFLGVGKKQNQYEAEIFQPAVVEITYKTKARISARIGKAFRGELMSLRDEWAVKRELQKLGLSEREAELSFIVAMSTISTLGHFEIRKIADFNKYWDPVTCDNLALRWAAVRYELKTFKEGLDFDSLIKGKL